MKLKRILKNISSDVDIRLKDKDVASISYNSKDIKKNSLFVAIKGLKNDGHKFTKEALRKGGLACVVSYKEKKNPSFIRVKDTRKALSVIAANFYGNPSEKLKVVGITGTNGKTTISFIMKSILEAARIPTGLIGTIAYKRGNTHVPAERTTPSPIVLNDFMDKALKSGIKAVAMEVSSHAIDQKRTDDIYFDAAIFTNLTHEHLDYHGTMRKYLLTKAKIFRNLKKHGTAILNADDEKVFSLRKKIKNKVITYGISKKSFVGAKIQNINSDGTIFDVLVSGRKKFSVNANLVGLHNVSNILASIAVSISFGIDYKTIKRGIEEVNSVEGRLEPVDEGQDFKVFVDYAHTHNALYNVISYLNDIKKRNIITVFGCGGNRDKKKRPLMGSVAEKLSDYVIITSDNPRDEDPIKIMHDIRKGIKRNSKKCITIEDRRLAIEKALKMAEKDDIVLIAGKGHENEQIIGSKRIKFNDKEIAGELIRKCFKTI